jgi:hypothetical protein
MDKVRNLHIQFGKIQGEEEKTPMERKQKFLYDRQMDYKENKPKIRKFLIVFAYISVFSLSFRSVTSPREGVRVDFVHFILSVLDLPERGNLWEFISPAVAVFSEIRESWRRILFVFVDSQIPPA